jgi:hypothetical protein
MSRVPFRRFPERNDLAVKKPSWTSKELQLSKETLRALEDPGFVRPVAGGVASARHCTVPFTNQPTCDPFT